MDSGTTTYLAAIWGSSPTDVFAVGGRSASTDDKVVHYDGEVWRAMPIATSSRLTGIWGSSGSSVTAVGAGNGVVARWDGLDWKTAGAPTGLYGVWGSSDANILAGGYSAILRYDGTSWVSMQLPSGVPWRIYAINDFWGISATDVFAVGNDNSALGPQPAVILHYDGTAWAAMPNGFVSIALTAISGTSRSDVFAVGSGGTILHHDGAIWSRMTSGTTERLNDVWAASSSDVFAVGEQGSILHYDGEGWRLMARHSGFLAGVWGWPGRYVLAVGADGVILRMAHMPPFTDDPLTQRVSPIKAVHIRELRQRVDTLRSRCGLPAFPWLDTALGSAAVVKALHVEDLRRALSEVYHAAGRPAPTWSTPAIRPGDTIISASEVSELRSAVMAVW
jgi:hypothetical protein